MKKIDKRIFQALEEQKPNKLGNLVGGFMAIAIGTAVLEHTTKSLKENGLL